MRKYEAETIEYIREHPGCSDREIADFILGPSVHQAPINSLCRELEGRGIVKRTARPIRNYLASDYIKAGESFDRPIANERISVGERKPYARRNENKERIIECIKEYPGLSDRQITDVVFGEGKPQQPVNIICRMLAEQGIIVRTERPIRNYMAGTVIEDVPIVNVPPAKRGHGSSSVPSKPKVTHTTKETLLLNLGEALAPMLGDDGKLKGEVSLNELLTLKSAVSPINNLITYELSLRFLERLYDQGFLSEDQFLNQLIDQENTSSNANGFDIFDDESKMIGEVKGTDPYGGNRYGPAQVTSIVKDFIGLASGKTKGREVNHDEYYKFMVLLDIKGAREAAAALLRQDGISSLKYPSVIVDDGDYKLDQINVVLVSLGD